MTWTRAAARRCSTIFATTGLTLAATLAATPAALAQGANETKPAPQQPVLAFEHSGIAQMFPDDRDAGLVRAISMLGARLKELKADPKMDPEFRQIPDQAIDLLDTLINDPMRVGVTLGGIDEQTRLPHFGVVVSLDLQDQADAASLDQDVDHLRAMSGMQITPEPSKRFQGMHDLALPFGMLTYGPHRTDTGWHYQILFGEVENPNAVASYLPKPEHVQTTAGRAMLDLAALTPVSEMLGGMLTMFAPQGADLMRQFHERGFVGPDAMKIEMVSGYTPTASVKRVTLQRAGKFVDALNISQEPLTNQDLGIVPADATVAQVKRMNVDAVWQSMRKQFAQSGQAEEVDNVLAQFKEKTGVDIENDIIAALGDTVAAYLSDSTGGSSLLSAVVAVKLSDPQKIQSALTRLTDTANKAAGQLDLGPGALHLATANTPAGPMTTLRLLGLPIPIEPSFAIAGDWLVMGASPQACVAAANQATHARDGGLRANPRFASAYPANAKPIGIDFVDTQRTMRAGYTPLSLLTTAFSNFITSPNVGAQDPGQILMGYNDLAKSCRPIMAYSHWVGDDLVFEVDADRSILVNAAGILGMGDAGPIVAGAILGGSAAAAAAEKQQEMRWSQPSSNQKESQPESNDVQY